MALRVHALSPPPLCLQQRATRASSVLTEMRAHNSRADLIRGHNMGTNGAAAVGADITTATNPTLALHTPSKSQPIPLVRPFLLAHSCSYPPTATLTMRTTHGVGRTCRGTVHALTTMRTRTRTRAQEERREVGFQLLVTRALGPILRRGVLCTPAEVRGDVIQTYQRSPPTPAVTTEGR